MARQKLNAVEFTQGVLRELTDGKRVATTRVTRSEAKLLEVDEELGIIYVDSDRYSIHSTQIRKWTVFAPPVPKKA